MAVTQQVLEGGQSAGLGCASHASSSLCILSRQLDTRSVCAPRLPVC